MRMEMGFSSVERQERLGIMGDEDDGSISSDVSSLESSDDESEDASEENSSDSFPSSDPRTEEGALGDMSDLLQQLPFKRGLSKHYQGKSQSFTSLANAISLQDLAKPEHPYNLNKKLKSCKSYMGLSQAFSHPHPTRSVSSSKLFGSSTNASFLSRPPTRPPHGHGRANATKASGFSNQTPLFV